MEVFEYAFALRDASFRQVIQELGYVLSVVELVMITILAVFLSSLLLALLLTPLAGRLGHRYELLDNPSHRKVHNHPIPRIGGIAIYLAFYLPFFGALLGRSSLLNQIFVETSLRWVLAGSTVVFVLGLVDDIHRLRPGTKIAFQLVAAIIAYAGGIRIELLGLPWGTAWATNWLSFPVTLLWFLLVVNAINLIDGLDGLAAGITLFVCLVLLSLSMVVGRSLVTAGLAALAGCCLGFLRYNFNPASIFMGDCGSYFIGYILAALSVLGSIKSQATVTLLIPIIALGLPLMDTILAPLRRFFLGKDLFQPDTSHIHHKLMKMGMTQRKAVSLMYAGTVVLGIFALLIVHMHDERSSMILIILAIVIILGIRKLGYLEYVALDRIISYFYDVTDEMGLNRDRRTFLNRQIAINNALDINDMWKKVIDAIRLLEVDQAEMHLNGGGEAASSNRSYRYSKDDSADDQIHNDKHVLTINLPLLSDRTSYGSLRLRKNLMLNPVSHYTLRRIEHLRRTIVRKLKAFEEENSNRVV